ARSDGLERALAEVSREDDVDDVLGRERADRSDRVHDRDRTLDGRVVVDSDLLGQLTVKRVDEALAGVDAPAGEQPVLAAALLVPAEQQAPLPEQDRRDADP